jgi:RND family efflux transporter MFP subunit
MKQKMLIPFAVLAASLAGAFLLVATAPSVENAPPERAILAVRTIDAPLTNVRLTVRSQGTVAPRTESALVPEVSGRVVWVSSSLVSGGFFEKGAPLLRLDARDYEMAVARARISVVRAKSELEYASSELKRQQGLSARDVASAAKLSAAKRAQRVAGAGLAEAQVALEQADWDLERTELVAPFEGRVREKSVDVGQFVNRGSAFATLYATDFAEIRLPIADHQLAYLDLPGVRGEAEGEGPIVHLHARFAGARQEWTGRIVRTEGEIDRRSRMVHVVAQVEDPYGMSEGGENVTPLAVGLFVQAEIEGPMAEDVRVVPRYAMRDADHILVVDAEHRLRSHAVEVLRIDRDDVLIRTELAPGERICISPLQVVVEGMAVQPIDDGPPSDASPSEEARS